MSVSINEEFLYVNNAVKYFAPPKKSIWKTSSGMLKAVDDISLSIKKGEALGLVGESGCGKSTLGRCLINLIPLTQGGIFYKGKNINELPPNTMDEMQMVFQNPFSSLNPRRTIGSTLTEVLKVKKLHKGRESEKVRETLRLVGLNEDSMEKYPHQFSGGQLQRIAIARTLLVEPEFIIADEPVSALDVSVQAQILNLFSDLKKKYGITILFISHNLNVVKHLSDRVAVMYLGQIVEIADVREIYENTLHPYTQAIIASVPVPDPDGRDNFFSGILEGELPSPMDAAKGCRFAGRCRYCMDVCNNTEPLLLETKSGSAHYVACHRVNEPFND